MNILALLAQAQPTKMAVGCGGLLIIMLFYGLPILGIVWVIRYLIRAGRERQRLRLVPLGRPPRRRDLGGSCARPGRWRNPSPARPGIRLDQLQPGHYHL